MTIAIEKLFMKIVNIYFMEECLFFGVLYRNQTHSNKYSNIILPVI